MNFDNLVFICLLGWSNLKRFSIYIPKNLVYSTSCTLRWAILIRG